MRELVKSSKHVNYNRVSTSNYSKFETFWVHLNSVLEIIVKQYARSKKQRVSCNLCDWSGSNFVNFYTGYGHVYRNAVCPRCYSHPRHRSYAISIKDTLTRFTCSEIKVLHFSPEAQITEALCADARVNYLSVDIDHRKAMRKEDIRKLSFKDNSFDFIVCMHVFEHIDEDKQAMREIHRVLKPSGVALLDVPIDSTRADTYEDSSVITPEARTQEFLQWDHLRLYGRNYPDVLAAEGFRVEIKDVIKSLGRDFVEAHGLEASSNYFGFK